MSQNVIQFAHSELQKYLKTLNVTADIQLGLFQEFGIAMEVAEPYFDDAIAISVHNQKGYIAGSNGRSVLIGVYRLLSEWGIGWVRPGKNGTHYPDSCSCPDVDIQEAASKRHRTICIEGAVSIENVLDMIDWLPKVGYNGYYIQFSLPYEFFERWYSHRHNPTKSPEPFTVEKAEEYHKLMIREIKRRGLLLHAVGHGWHCAPFGISDHGWYKPDPESIPQSYKDICALVNGKRTVWRDTPLYTQLCYSNPYVRETMVQAVVRYVENNPEADIIHFWLGDYFNNTCECPACQEGHYADHYIRIVNEITDILAARNLDKKVCFIVCYNTSHPPKFEKIKNPEHSFLLFAPITRTFAESFPNGFRLTSIPEYKTNKVDIEFGKAGSVDENLAYLNAWKQVFDGDAADFDYHLMWDHILDAGGEGIAKIIYDDIRNFESLGMNGLISCQLQRNMFPTSIAMTTMAKTLWNNDADFDEIRRNLYAAAFGDDALDALCNYFSVLSDAFDIGAIRGQRITDRAVFKAKMEKALQLMEEFKEVIAAHLQVADPCHKESWEILNLHRQAYSLVGQAIAAKLNFDEEQGNALIEAAHAFIWDNEDKLQSVLDTMYFYRMTKERITVNKLSEFTVI